MFKKIDKQEVKRIADLSMLSFTDEESDEMCVHLRKVLEYFETLDGVDVSDVPATAHILSVVNVLRDDVIMPSTDNAELLKNAPETKDGAYVVPRVVE